MAPTMLLTLLTALGLTLVQRNAASRVETALGRESILLSTKYNAISNITKLEYNCGAVKADLPTYDSETSELWVELKNCLEVPVGLYVNSTQLRKLTLSAPNPTCCVDQVSLFWNFPAHTLDGLGNLTELRLLGFERLTTIEPSSLAALKSIQRLHLEGFGSDFLSFAKLAVFFRDLANSPIQEIAMKNIHSQTNQYADLNFNEIFGISNVTITKVSIDDSYISAMSGRISQVLPELESLSLSLSDKIQGINVTSILDIIVIAPKLNRVHIYGYPNLSIITIDDTTRLVEKSPDIDAALRRYKDRSCLWNYRMPVFPTTKSLSLNHLSYFPNMKKWNIPWWICFENNVTESIDSSDSQFLETLPYVPGLYAVKTVNFRNVGMNRFNIRQLSSMPKLETLYIGSNDLGKAIKNDERSQLFQGAENLKTLDLSECKLSDIPYLEFNYLISLVNLNLSGNSISTVDWMLENCSQLAVLNLSNNIIEQFPISFIFQLNKTRETEINPLEIDIRENPLSCLCNATQFISWMQTQNSVVFTGLNTYTCLYPNGSSLILMNVNVEELTDQCSVLSSLRNNSACPCDAETEIRCNTIRYALGEYFCSDAFGDIYNMINLNASKCIDYRTTGWFIGSVVGTGSFILILTVTVTFGVVYKRRGPVAFKRWIEHLAPPRLVSYLMEILFNEEEVRNSAGNIVEPQRPVTERTSPQDAFVIYHPNDHEYVTDELLPRLQSLGAKVLTENDIPFGSFIVEEAQLCIKQSRYIILILTQDFIECFHSKYLSILSLNKITRIIPLVPADLTFSNDEAFFSILANKPPFRRITWSRDADQQERIAAEVWERMKVPFVKQLSNEIVEAVKVAYSRNNSANETTPLLA